MRVQAADIAARATSTTRSSRPTPSTRRSPPEAPSLAVGTRAATQAASTSPAASGVTALKIEGRLRNAAYVSRAVQMYRSLIDASPVDRTARRKEGKAAPGSTRESEGGYFRGREYRRLVAANRPGGFGEELGGARQRLEDVRRRLEQLAALNAELRELEERLAVLANLDLYLRSDRFEAYVLGHALADLAANASVIIHELTEGRYELTYEDEFFVRDTWMDSYRRSVKTLSGGESFIVSLSLALALADTIAGRQSLGALFLDEGFGTLDAESLDSVTEVLTNLTSTGRMVGVITHVTSLTERLPARLVVSKGQLGSSLAWDA